MSTTHLTPAAKAAENLAGQIPSLAASQEKQRNRGSRRTRRLGMPWIRRYTHRYKDEAILNLLRQCGHAALAWLDMIELFLASLWEAEGEQGLTYPVSYWLEQVCLLKRENLTEFEKFLQVSHELGLLRVERKGDALKIASPDLIALADDYTRKRRRKQEKQDKKPSTRERLARLEEQVSKLTEVVTQLTQALQGRTAAPAPAAPASSKEEEPSEEEKEEILSKFKKKFGLETDDWRKAVILLAFPPKTSPGPGYLTKMTDLSQTPLALARWRERRKKQLEPDRLQKLEEARVYAEMVRQGFNFSEVPAEIAGLVQKILERRGNGYAQRA